MMTQKRKEKYERKKEMKNEDILGTQMSKCIYTPGIQGGGPPPQIFWKVTTTSLKGKWRNGPRFMEMK